MTIIFIC